MKFGLANAANEGGQHGEASILGENIAECLVDHVLVRVLVGEILAV